MVEHARRVPDWLAIAPHTLAKLEFFLDLVIKWNPGINLVSARSISEAWERHVLDSAQLWPLAAVSSGLWLDLGSGGGFPGLVVAILAQQDAIGLQVRLVESDRRKAVFLREAVRMLQLSVDVQCARAESIAPQAADVVSARAFAPLTQLLPLAARHLGPAGFALFPKGVHHRIEIDDARRHWNMETDVLASKTNAGAAIVKVWDLRNV